MCVCVCMLSTVDTQKKERKKETNDAHVFSSSVYLDVPALFRLSLELELD